MLASTRERRVGRSAVDDSPREASVISPRGVCRELVYDYGPDADAIVPGESGSTKRSKRSISEFLPSRWH